MTAGAADPRIVFMGTPEYAVPVLKSLASGYSIIGVVTQPDRPAGRGRKLEPPPVKTVAESLGLPTIQPRSLREAEALERLAAWQPDLIIVVAFGQILRPAVLDLPTFGCLNIHASLLPRWRGAAPIQAAILHGDQQTGATVMRMDPGIDTGPVLSQSVEPILPDDTAGSLAERLASLGAELLLETLPGYLAGAVMPLPQDGSQATYAPTLRKVDGLLDFNRTAVELSRIVRAFNPWPGAYTTWKGEILKIHRVAAVSSDWPDSLDMPGARQIIDGQPAVAAEDGWLVLKEVQPAGKKSIPGKAFLQGARDWLEG